MDISYLPVRLLVGIVALALLGAPPALLAQSTPGNTVYISEVMFQPRAVSNLAGEWVELYNAGPAPINLRNWVLHSGVHMQQRITADVWLEPGAYVVLARHADSTLNGGVQPHFVYTNLELANWSGTLTLSNPSGQDVDSFATHLLPPRPAEHTSTHGASVERTAFGGDDSAAWMWAHSPWIGSAGDWGSPGLPYQPPPAPQPTAEPIGVADPAPATPTPLPEPSATISPTATATLTPTATATPLATVVVAGPKTMLITELLIDPHVVADHLGEWVELHNIGAEAVNLRDWQLHDDGKDFHAIVGDLWVAPGGYVVLARNGDPLENGGIVPAYVYRGLQLANEGDELYLVAPDGTPVDQVVWGPGIGRQARAGRSLERSAPLEHGVWVEAVEAWPASAGDWGTPGTAFVARPVPPTPTATPPVASPTALPTLEPTPAPTATPAPSMPVAAGPKTMLITELLIDPHAVADHLGEWVELHNTGADAVNLRDWQLHDAGQDFHAIVGDLWVAPGGYVVLARHGVAQENGGIAPAYVYRGLQLANEGDALYLVAPDGTPVDQVVWGPETGRQARPGRSLERSTPLEYGIWVEAVDAWPGSAGDWGTPGSALVARPAPPIPTAVPTPLGETWVAVTEISPLVIDQVYYGDPDQEFVTLLNRGGVALNLGGYVVGDAERPGKQEGLYALPADFWLGPGELYIIARQAQPFQARWGQPPHAAFEASDSSIPTLARRTELAGGRWALNNTGDEVVLLTPDLRLADVLVVRHGDLHGLGVTGILHAGAGESLQRVPGGWFPAVREQRHRFLAAAPAPFSSRALPVGRAQGAIALDDGYRAAWGSLGVASNFSDSGRAPPHYLQAAAGAAGLDYVAIADPIAGISAGSALSLVAPANVQDAAQSQAAVLPAWRWQGADGSAAIVYGEQLAGYDATLAHWPDLLAAVAMQQGVIQAQTLPDAGAAELAIFAADDTTAPGNMPRLVQSWAQAGEPLLPGGNGAPAIAGISSGQARYTGLAIGGHGVESAALLEAMRHRRGWLTTRPGLWLTLRTESGVWMGSRVAAGSVLNLEIAYGDRSGAPAGLALWQDGRLLHQLDTPPPHGRWTVQVPVAQISAQPGSFFYVVATQLGGDFAVTAPLLVVPGAASNPDTPSQLPPVTQPGHAATSVPQVADSVEDSVADTGAGSLSPTHGQATGPPGSLAMEKLRGLDAQVEFRAQVTVPPGLFNAAIYVAEPARLDTGAELPIAGLGIQVYLRGGGEFPPLAEGDWVLVRGRLRSYRGELEVQATSADQVWRIGPGTPLQPLVTSPAAIGESLESRLVTLHGTVVGWQGDSIYLADPDDPHADAVRVTVRSSLGWKRPFVQRGERYEVTGVISQFAPRAPWNGGYRLLVRYAGDIRRLDE